VSRERKRAKTDRLDAAMLMRVFLGWLRGERGHCGMVVIPTMEEEAARRPSRERESLVNERSRITNRMKSALARLGIRGFKPHLRKAPERLAGLRTAEGTGLPANIIEEFRRDMARLALVREQISSIEKTRAERLERAPIALDGGKRHLRLEGRCVFCDSGAVVSARSLLIRAHSVPAVRQKLHLSSCAEFRDRLCAPS
jgi:transposase